jgi:aryl-alcohol dehydrogenase-like predicted oxidoreductase
MTAASGIGSTFLVSRPCMRRRVLRRVTPAQLALAWLHRKGPDVVSIPDASRAERVEENAGALSVQLTPHEVAGLERSARVGAAAGERSLDMKSLNR